MKVLSFATEIDRSAQRFYEEMADRADSEGVRNIFRMLAEEECMQLARLESKVAEADAYDTPTLESGRNIYEQLRRREDQLAVADDVAAYRLAIEAERDVVKQYAEAADLEKNPLVRKMLVEIAEDERHILNELENLYDFANVPNNFLAWGEFSNLGEFHNFGRDVG